MPCSSEKLEDVMDTQHPLVNAGSRTRSKRGKSAPPTKGGILRRRGNRTKSGEETPATHTKEHSVEKQGNVHEATRQVPETIRRTEDAARQATREVTRAAEQATAMSANVMVAWADINQRVTRELLELWLGTAREGARLYGEMLQSTFLMAREFQAAALRYQTMWPEALRDPFEWYRKALEESIERTQNAFRAMGSSAEVMSQSVGRMQESAEKAGRHIQQAVSDAASKVDAAGKVREGGSQAA
jgi:hypothetical protein